MNSLQFAVHALRMTGRTAEADVLRALIRTYAMNSRFVFAVRIGNAVGATRVKVGKAVESLVSALLVERTKGRRMHGMHLRLRSVLPTSLALSVVEAAFGADAALPVLPVEYLQKMVEPADEGAAAELHTETRTKIALAGIVVSQWSRHALPEATLLASSGPNGAVTIEDEACLVPNEILFMDNNRAVFRLNYALSAASGIRVPDVSRSRRNVATTRRAVYQNFAMVTDSRQLRYARLEQLAEDVAYFATIAALVSEWNAQMPRKAALCGAVYVALRKLLCEAQMSVVTIRQAFACARTDEGWLGKSLCVLAGKPENIERLARSVVTDGRRGPDLLSIEFTPEAESVPF